jgi:hypothetical protein
MIRPGMAQGKANKVDRPKPIRSRFRYATELIRYELTARDGSAHRILQPTKAGAAKSAEPTDVLVPEIIDSLLPSVAIVAGDVEQRTYDAGFAARMKVARLARARRAPDWAERWLVLEDEYEQRRTLARTFLGDWVIDVDLHDGHVAEVELDARAFVERGAELLFRAPWVRHLHLSAYREVGPSFWGCSSLRGMQSIGLPEQGLSDDDIDALVASPYVDGLRWLDLSGNHLGPRAFEALASCPALIRLEYLGLEDNDSVSPVDRMGTDALDGTVVSTTHTQAGRALERLVGRTLAWLHAPAHFPLTYPPSPLDVATSD